MKRLIASGSTDVGQVRQANEDAYLLGDSIYAVADGMGGHLAGEVASATALEPVRQLDGRVFPDGATAVAALRAAVVEANRRVASKAAGDPNYRGMGTTLTAVMVEGRRVHIAHVGDSRAYLLRHGEFGQLTHDHTLVQHLIDEGHITIEEAATHPQRSVITRAIGVSLDVDVDSMTLDLVDGDALLLCSDGLTGVIPDGEIAEIVDAEPDLDLTIRELIRRANESGGPDNITVVLLRYGELPHRQGDTAELAAAGRRNRPPVVVNTREEGGAGDWASRLGSLGSLGTDKGISLFPSDDTTHRGGRWQKVTAIAIGFAVLLGLIGGGAWWMLSRSYYVGLDGQDVVIYRGIDAAIGPLELSWVAEETDLDVTEVPQFYREELEEGVLTTGLADARRIVENAPRIEESRPGDASDGATSQPSPSPSP